MKRKNRLLSKLHPNTLLTCVVCGLLKIPRKLENGKYEAPYNLMRRKTCGKDTECFRLFVSGKGNPNYKGYMPKCIMCGKKISYNSKIEMANGKIPKYCRKHADESYKNGEYHEIILNTIKKVDWKKVNSKKHK